MKVVAKIQHLELFRATFEAIFRRFSCYSYAISSGCCLCNSKRRPAGGQAAVEGADGQEAAHERKARDDFRGAEGDVEEGVEPQKTHAMYIYGPGLQAPCMLF